MSNVGSKTFSSKLKKIIVSSTLMAKFFFLDKIATIPDQRNVSSGSYKDFDVGSFKYESSIKLKLSWG